jgi:hypothetical protein
MATVEGAAECIVPKRFDLLLQVAFMTVYLLNTLVAESLCLTLAASPTLPR